MKVPSLSCHPEQRTSFAKRMMSGVEGPAFLAGTTTLAASIEKGQQVPPRTVRSLLDRTAWSG